MPFLQIPNAVKKEERTTVYVLPEKIVKTFGNVENAGALLKTRKYYQINLSDGDTVELSNGKTGAKAGILLDFGREMQGGIRLLCSAASVYCPNVLIRFGESVSEALTPVGKKNATNDHAIREFTVPVCFMSDQTWGGTGFRFVYIELAEKNARVSFTNILAAFQYRDLEYKGSFRCSDELVNRIFDTSAYTCHLCIQNYLWDGIKRDRLVWLGDSHPEMLTIRALFGRLPVFEESIDEARDSFPVPQWINGMPSYSLWWMKIVRDWYFYCGDPAYLRANADYLTAVTSQVLANVKTSGEIDLPSYFIDWPNSGTPAEKEGVKALCVLALEGAAELLRELGEAGLAARAEETVGRMKAFGADCTGSKSTEALGFLSGLEEAGRAADVLLNGGAKGVSTFFSYYVLTALSRTGHTDEAIAILKEYYGGMLDMGATSFWEDFSADWAENACPIDRIPEKGEKDIHGDFGAFCYKNLRHSLCHGWSSGPVPFLLESVLGISLAAPGGRKITVAPHLGTLAWAEGSFALPDGVSVRVRAEKKDGGVNVTAEAPDGVEVAVLLDN